MVGKLCSSKRQQNALAAAIKEYGTLRRTVYAVRYLAGEAYRCRIGRQLNKGENLHALQRSLAYAVEGALRRRHPLEPWQARGARDAAHPGLMMPPCWQKPRLSHGG